MDQKSALEPPSPLASAASGSPPERPRPGSRRLLLIVLATLGVVGAAIFALLPARGTGTSTTERSTAQPTHASSARDPRGDARAIVDLTQPIRSACDAGNRSEARARWRDFSDRWFEVEEPIKAVDRGAYDRIESRMQDVAAALPPDGDWKPDEVCAALATLSETCLAFARSDPTCRNASTSSPANAPAIVPVSVAAYLEEVGGARAAMTQGRELALARVDGLRERWIAVEPLVAARDKDAYVTSEESLAQARASVGRDDRTAATKALERLEVALAPLARGPAQYGALDAAAILLREGAEALLVLAALVAYLGKLGAADRTRLVWLGGVAGMLASLVLGLGLAWAFQGLAGGMRRELMEGISSLVAAVLLVGVGQWLHSKIHRGGWKKDVALAVREGRGLSLAAVAFFAVFREGGETVLFYAGMAPSTEPRSMALGIVIGLGLLAGLGWVVIGLGKRVPLGPFFTFATALLWLLAVKFVGAGVHSLQAASVVAVTPVAGVPSIEWLGLSPTLETCLAQLGAVLVWIGVQAGPRFIRRVRHAR